MVSLLNLFPLTKGKKTGNLKKLIMVMRPLKLQIWVFCSLTYAFPFIKLNPFLTNPVRMSLLQVLSSPTFSWLTSGLHCLKRSQQDVGFCRMRLSFELLTICERRAFPSVVNGHVLFSTWVGTF